MRKVWAGNKVEEKKKKRVTSAARNRARAELILVGYCKRTVIMDSFMSDVKKSWNKTEETHLLLNTNAVDCNELLILCVFGNKKKTFAPSLYYNQQKVAYRYCSSKG